jgi:hypothetical protein
VIKVRKIKIKVLEVESEIDKEVYGSVSKKGLRYKKGWLKESNVR